LSFTLITLLVKVLLFFTPPHWLKSNSLLFRDTGGVILKALSDEFLLVKGGFFSKSKFGFTGGGVILKALSDEFLLVKGGFFSKSKSKFGFTCRVLITGGL